MEIIILLAAILLLIIVRIILHFSDKNRITSAAEKHSWKIIEIIWDPFAPGWFAETRERHYSVKYIDESGITKKRICKTSLFTGVYWRDDIFLITNLRIYPF